MLNPPDGWPWFIVGLIVGIGGNLFSNWLQRYFDSHTEKRRAKKLRENKDAQLYVESMVTLAKVESGVLTVMAQHAATYQALSIKYLIMGCTLVLIAAITVSTAPYFATDNTLLNGTWIVIVLVTLLGVDAIIRSIRVSDQANLYATIINIIHKEQHIPKLPTD